MANSTTESRGSFLLSSITSSFSAWLILHIKTTNTASDNLCSSFLGISFPSLHSFPVNCPWKIRTLKHPGPSFLYRIQEALGAPTGTTRVNLHLVLPILQPSHNTNNG